MTQITLILLIISLTIFHKYGKCQHFKVNDKNNTHKLMYVVFKEFDISYTRQRLAIYIFPIITRLFLKSVSPQTKTREIESISTKGWEHLSCHVRLTDVWRLDIMNLICNTIVYISLKWNWDNIRVKLIFPFRSWRLVLSNSDNLSRQPLCATSNSFYWDNIRIKLIFPVRSCRLVL